MINYLQLDDTHIQIEYGILGGVSSVQKYRSGELESVKLTEKNMVVTHAGELVPAYHKDERRKNKASVEFGRNGLVKAVLLDKQSEVETPIGTLPAEYITFYETGEVHRVFTTDGQISGFWSETDEKEFNIPLSFDFAFASFTARLNGICFYKSGAIKSITLYPGEEIALDTPAGEIKTRIGFSLYESGILKSVEPEEDVYLMTRVGTVNAYNPNAIGINADSNSLVFSEAGEIMSLRTGYDKISVQTDAEEYIQLLPEEKPHPLHDDIKMKLAMKMDFNYADELVTITNDEVHTFSLTKDCFHIERTEKWGCTPMDCASCSLCKSGD